MTSSDDGITARTRALDAVWRQATRHHEFTVTDIVEAADRLSESNRSTVQRALREMEALGRVSQRKPGSRYWESNLLPDRPDERSFDDLPEPTEDLRILHVFADRGVEAEALSCYGDVLRVGWNALGNDCSTAIRADANHLPIKPGVTFDLGVFHPPCTKWADMTSISGDPDEHPNLIPLSRELGEQFCDEWIIENKPAAPLNDAVTLSGKMFGLPISYERAFETTFPVHEVPHQQSLTTECSPYFSADRSRAWWAGVKGYPRRYPKQHLAKNCVPAAYVHHLMRAYLRATNRRDADYARATHSDPTPRRIANDD